MQSLLEDYSLSTIAVIVAVFIGLIPNFMKGVSYVVSELKSFFGKGFAEEQHDKEVDKQLQEIEKFYQEKAVVDKYFSDTDKAIADTNKRVDGIADTINKRIDVLIESDKEAIKSYITEKHHFFCYTQGWIGYYDLECLERRFAVYQEEHGNSFVGGLMDEIRDLPEQPPAEDSETKGKIENTNRYVRNKKKG